jgi:hypothetical protein
MGKKTEVFEAVSDSVVEEERMGFEAFAEAHVAPVNLHMYTRAYLVEMYRGQVKTAKEWASEPEIAKLKPSKE